MIVSMMHADSRQQNTQSHAIYMIRSILQSYSCIRSYAMHVCSKAIC